MGRAIILSVSLLVVIALLAMACVSTSTPAGFDPLMNQASARMTVTAAHVVQAEADAIVTAIVQKTVEARQEDLHRLTVEASVAQATAQASADATATVVAQAEATAQRHVEETLVAATLQAGQAQATSTAQAQATGTAVAATATAQIENPIATRTAAETEAYVTTKTWEQRMAPWEFVGKALFWTAIGLFFVLACAWVFPRAWIALQTRFLRFDGGAGDGPKLVLVGSKGWTDAWLGRFVTTFYDGDRDRGPGQSIDQGGNASLLPGSDPRVTERDQIVDGLTRPVQAARNDARSRTPRPRAPQPWRAMPAPSARQYRVLNPEAALPSQVERVLDAAVMEKLDRDWEGEEC